MKKPFLFLCRPSFQWTCFLLIFLVISCKSKSPACFIDAADIQKGAVKKQIILKDDKYRITSIYDADWDSLKGGVYIFYPTEFLKSYTFYQFGKPVYTESYDESGNQLQTKGSPMVDRIITELSEDSASIQVFFFSLLKTYQQLDIKINDSPPMHFTLEKDTIFTDLKSVSFTINTSGMTHINMYSQIKYVEDCKRVEHVLSDSLFLVKNPHLEPAPAGSK